MDTGYPNIEDTGGADDRFSSSLAYLDLNQIKHLILLQMMKGTKLTSNYVLRRAITIDHVQFTINIAFRYSSI
ncbi:MAG: hypothetical protein ACRD8Z_29115, partial [Nitrososphaeraceae archaeon]